MSRVWRGRPTYRPVEQGQVVATMPEAPTPSAKDLAESILAKARAQAADIVKDAEAHRGRIREEATDEGYREGYAAGCQEAQNLIDQAALALEDARRSLGEMLRESEPRLLALVLEISKRILGDALEEDPTRIMSLVTTGVSLLRDEKEFSVYVDPALVALVEGERETLRRNRGIRSMEVFGDPDIGAGTVVMTPNGYVDARIDTQVKNVAQALSSALRQTREGDEP